jgi:PGDYG protein
MQALRNIDLACDAAAQRFVKIEEVDVTFAQTNGEVCSSVGRNLYCAGDALITGSNGDCWSVSRDRFAGRYEAVADVIFGADGRYCARRQIVWAKQMHSPFSIARSAAGDLLHGHTLDWLLQYAPGDFGIVDRARFERVYRAA